MQGINKFSGYKIKKTIEEKEADNYNRKKFTKKSQNVLRKIGGGESA